MSKKTRTIGALRATSTRLRNLAAKCERAEDARELIKVAEDVEGRLLLLGATVLPNTPPRTEPIDPEARLRGFKAARTKVAKKLEKIHPRFKNKRMALWARLSELSQIIAKLETDKAA